MLRPGQKYNSGSTYRLAVDWTVSPNATPGSDGIWLNLFVNQPNSRMRANVGATDAVNIIATPEPAMWLTFGSFLAVVIWVKRRADKLAVAGPNVKSHTG